MKKFNVKNTALMLLVMFGIMTTSMTIKAQSSLPKCFCCSDSIYQFPTTPPPINGPSPICPCSTTVFSTTPCPGATFVWTVKDNLGNNVPFTGQGTSTITVGPINPAATSITISLVIKCGRLIKENKIEVKVNHPLACFGWSITADGLGGYTVSATANPSAAGFGDAWRFNECVGGQQSCMTTWCNGPAGGSTGCPSVGAGNAIAENNNPNFNWNSAGTCTLIPGKTYRLVHWVEKCHGPTWVADPCRALCWICFTIDTSGERGMAKPAKGTKVKLINVSEGTEILKLTPEMLR